MIILLGAVIIALLADLLLILLWQFNFKEYKVSSDNTSDVSIIIAARNEEKNIIDCLESLVKLDYPKDRMEILIGDDQSSDRTAEIVQAYMLEYPFISLYAVEDRKIEGNGKANAVAQLVEKAKFDVLLFTDADIEVPRQWVWGMLSGLDSKVGMITGTSLISGKNWLARVQRMDWLFATGMLKVMSDLGKGVTSLGNNMLITRRAYDSVGGFEGIPFSVTEDLEMFKQVSQTYSTRLLFRTDVLNYSKPQTTLTDLLIQRKRWIQGALGLPARMVILLLIQAGYLVVIIALMFFYPMLGIIALGAKLFLRFVFAYMVGRKINQKVELMTSFAFEIFNLCFSFISLLYYLFTGKVEWKNRKY